MKRELTQQQNLPLVGEVELVYRSKTKASERPVITNSLDSTKVLREIYDIDTIEHHEEFKVLLLNRANRVLGAYTAGKGGQAATIADPKMIFQAALKANAASIIISHNHPSGSLKPSSADIAITNKLVNAGSMLDINVLDHIIITADGYFSFADERIL